MAHAAYSDVAALPEDSLLTLLERGEPTEKVWAAWALGTRVGTAAAGAMQAAAHSAPEPGVRRQVIVVLVGLGKIDAVCVLSTADPDASVRATACRYLIRLAAARPALWEIALGRLADPAPLVRVAIVEEIAGASSEAVLASVLRLIGDDSLDVRRAVADLAARRVEDGAGLPGEVSTRLAKEPDPDLREQWQRLWLTAKGAKGFLPLLAAEGDEGLVREGLERIAALDVRADWAEVSAAAGLVNGVVGPALMGLFKTRLDRVPLSVILDYLGAEGRDDVCAWPYLDHLTKRLGGMAPGALSAHERIRLADLALHARRLEQTFTSMSWPEDEEESSWPEEDRASWEDEERAWQDAVKTFAALCERLASAA